MDDSTAVAYASLLLVGGVQLMDQLGPGIDAVRTAGEKDAKLRAQLNVAEAWAGVVVLSAGAVVTGLVGRWEPMVMAGIVVVGSVVAYELAWHANPSRAVEPGTGRVLVSG